jgi:hypothetical protein
MAPQRLNSVVKGPSWILSDSGEKFGNSFNPKTLDIVVAIISGELFERWWTELRSCRSWRGGWRLRERFASDEDLLLRVVMAAISRQMRLGGEYHLRTA